MAKNPFKSFQRGHDIKDSGISIFTNEIDGDIIIADSYRKKAKNIWKNTFGLRVIMLLYFVVFGIIFIKLYYLQVIRGAEYYGAAEGNRIQSIPIMPSRGVVFDENLTKLAYNVPDFALYVIPSKLPKDQSEEDEIFKTISECLGIDQFDLIESFANIPRIEYSEIELIRGITQEQAITLARYIEQWDGIFLVTVQQRSYIEKESLSHVLGYTGKMSQEDYDYFEKSGYLLTEHVGKTGLEKQYQKNLRGTPGALLVEVSSNNVPTRTLERKEPIIGDNIFLNINYDLQEFIWAALEELNQKIGVKGASVVVMDPNNGAVKALVSYPGFNNNIFSRGISSSEYESLLSDAKEPLFNRTISGEYPSGSTIKLVIGAAALQEGIVDENDTVFSSGGIDVNGYWFPDWKAGGHGNTNIIHAIADSVNTYFYTVGGGYDNIEGLGVEKISEYGKLFGLSEKTGIDLPSEASGFLPSKKWKEETKGEKWYLGDTYHLSIGQGDILVTPIQVANFTATIANGGILYKPRLVERIGTDYATAQKMPSQIIRKNFIDPYNISLIQKGLRAAAIYGSTRSLSDLPVEAAGKTGTAQFSEEKSPHAWFTGYAPYNEPEIVVTVLIEEGEGGDKTATPIAKKIFQWYFDKKTEKTRSFDRAGN